LFNVTGRHNQHSTPESYVASPKEEFK
jgi:hypothetical protein